MVREYSRHITKFRGGAKVNKNTWRLNANSKKIQYEVYCFERTVRTSFVDENMALLVGATLLPLLPEPFEIQLLLPKSWKFVSSALKFRKIGAGKWQAKVKDMDEWIDSPIVSAHSDFGGVTRFTSRGISHYFTWVGIKPAIDYKQMVKDVKKICDHIQKMFTYTPFTSYHYLVDFFPNTYGGLEHRSSQFDQFDNIAMEDKEKYKKYMGLIAHEYFHAWNVKSLRPEALGPFDYLEENYTDELWFAEGLTAYFDEKIVFDCGLMTKDEYANARRKDANDLKDGYPGHARRSVAESSFDAWIRLYRRDEDWFNTDVNYYVKGAQVAWCWDAYLEKKTRKRWNLARLIKSLHKQFGIRADENLREAQPGYSRAEIFEYAEQVTGISHKVVRTWVESHRPLPWKDAAKHFKIPLKEKVTSPNLHWMGVGFQVDRQPLTVKTVFSGSTGEAAGISCGDELLAIEDAHVRNTKALHRTLTALTTKKQLMLTISRGDRIFRKRVQLKKHAGIGVDWESPTSE